MLKKDFVSARFKDQLERELSPDELILWADEPTPIVAKNFLLLGIFFAFLIFSSIIKPFNAASASLFAALIVFAIFLWSQIQFKKTLYIITNKRALIIKRNKTFTIRSYPPHLLQFIYLTEKKLGIGDLIFEENISVRPNNTPKVQQFGFVNVRKVRLVEQMLRSLAKNELEQK